jgi:GAF domain-containing protein
MPRSKTIKDRLQSDSKEKSKAAKQKIQPPTAASYSALKRRFDAQAAEFREALEREVATSEILRMIARSPGDLQSILDATVANAAKLCDAVDAAVWCIDGDVLRLAAHFESVPMLHGIGDSDSIDRDTATGRAIVERQTIQVHDVVAAQDEFPKAKTHGAITGTRTALAAPLLRDGNVIGAINIRRTEVRPFTNRQVKILESFADQAVIAIENARLFQERETRNRELSALHDVTAAASQSLEIRPVLDEVVKKITEIFNFDSVSIFLARVSRCHRQADSRARGDSRAFCRRRHDDIFQ